MRKRGSTCEIPYVPTGTRLGKKALALFLSVAMFLPMLPTVALADNRDAATTDEYGLHRAALMQATASIPLAVAVA